MSEQLAHSCYHITSYCSP